MGNLRNRIKDQNTFFNLVKILSVSVCLIALVLSKIGAEAVNPKLLAQNFEESEESVLGVYYKRPTVAPIASSNIYDPEIYATSAIVMDADTRTILFAQNIDEQRPMASTTKLMTALASLREFSPTRVISIDAEDVAVGGSSMYLLPGEEFLLKDLIKGLLIPSGNDAALTLENEFKTRGKDLIVEMNEYALALGMNNTHFVNASGLDDEDHYSTAHDMAMLASFAIQDYTIRSSVNISETIVYSLDGVHGHYLKSTNELLGEVEGVDGMKTGYTLGAGQCLISSVVRNGHRIVTVVLNSPDRFAESETLIEWTYNNYSWE